MTVQQATLGQIALTSPFHSLTPVGQPAKPQGVKCPVLVSHPKVPGRRTMGVQFCPSELADCRLRKAPMSDDTHYTVLGISETATQSEIKAAYRNLLKQIHPDTVSTLSPDLRGMADEVTKDLTEAYSVLSDASKRQQYDRELGLGEHRLESVRPPTTPAVPRGPQVWPQASPAVSNPQWQQQVHHYRDKGYAPSFRLERWADRHPVRAGALVFLAWTLFFCIGHLMPLFSRVLDGLLPWNPKTKVAFPYLLLFVGLVLVCLGLVCRFGFALWRWLSSPTVSNGNSRRRQQVSYEDDSLRLRRWAVRHPGLNGFLAVFWLPLLALLILIIFTR
jgi:hypothetical protein